MQGFHAIEQNRAPLHPEILLRYVCSQSAAGTTGLNQCDHHGSLLDLQIPDIPQDLTVGSVLAKKKRCAQHKALHTLGSKFPDPLRTAGSVPVQFKFHFFLDGQQLRDLLAYIGQLHLSCISGIH